MSLLRKAIFWLHLSAGLLAGLVILVLAVTGVIMSFERQILESTTGLKIAPGLASVGPEAILTAQAEAKPPATAITYNSDPEKPAIVQFGRGKALFVDPYSGESLGEGNVKTKEFFGWVLRLHRWLAMEGESREVAGMVIKVANMVFLFLVISGLWLWFPKRWTKSGWKAITRIQWRLKGRARDWNWHNVFGFWACIPLFFIVVTGAVMSFTWANNLVYRMVGEAPPPPRGQGGGGEGAAPVGGGGERRAPGGGEGGAAMAREGGGERRGGARPEGAGREGAGREGGERRERGGRGGGEEASRGPVSLVGLNAGFEAVKASNAGWRTIQISLPKGTTSQFAVSESHRGRPDLRKTLTVDLTNSQVVKTESMASQSTGRQLRTWVRWIHTGEAFGWIGQTVTGLSALSAVILVWTGFALTWRRFKNRRKKSAGSRAAVV